ncbi:DNA binding protein isoform 1 [Dorcoceras hygrometricum]|uniref:protein-serine/threonine phosphatase n=1 Tax=Dorcoceras hygrometricum TaxID=472368 RepID=A0A2Z7AA32_9LAMI|nr:DNA binding protein isoform 1 [Dorcoceras hygrometricum]
MKLPFSSKDVLEDVSIGVAAIFDGHGGKEASELASRKILDYLFLHVVFIEYGRLRLISKNNSGSHTLRQEGTSPGSETRHKILEEALLRTIQDIELEFNQEASEKGYVSGCTAIIVLLVDGQFFIANIGDSKALLCSGQNQTPYHTGSTLVKNLVVEELTRDHHPDREDEKARITAAGGIVSWWGVPRVNGILAISRAIGDVQFKRYGVIADPEVVGWRCFKPENRYLVLASDGVFEVFTPQNVCDLLHGKTPESSSEFVATTSLADRISRKAFKAGSTDNLSVIVISILNNTLNYRQIGSSSIRPTSLNYSFRVKEEYPSWQQPIADTPPAQPTEYGAAVGHPRPIEGLHEMGPPPFLTKTYDMVDDPNTNHIVSWSRGGHSFVVWDPHSFSTNVLSNYFKHNNFSSFVRQLNTYGFRKTDPDRWEFTNEAFLEGQKHLLRNIRRRKAPAQSVPPQQDNAEPCVEVGRFGVDGEIDRLTRDKHVLMMELVKLRQQQQTTRAYLQQMELRLQGTERKQQQMMSFLARAMQNPEFIHQLVQHKEKRKQLEDAVSKKRRRPIEYGESSRTNKGKTPIKAEPLDLGDSDGYFQVSELEALALEMQGFGKPKREHEDADERELTELGSYDKELDDGFWEELLNERFDQEQGTSKKEEEEEEDVNCLADRLGILGSSPQ